MRYFLCALGSLILGYVIYRRVTWRVEEPISEQKRRAFGEQA